MVYVITSDAKPEDKKKTIDIIIDGLAKSLQGRYFCPTYSNARFRLPETYPSRSRAIWIKPISLSFSTIIFRICGSVTLPMSGTSSSILATGP